MRNQNVRQSNTHQRPQTTIKNSNNQSLKQLRILDYRNGKYQGFTSGSNFNRNGLGILIDDKYSFILTQWKENKIEGPFFMIYPDQSILYGFIQKQKIGEMVSYEVNKQFNMILSKNTNTLIVDLLPSRTILTFKVDHKFLNQHNLQSILKIQFQSDKKQQINNGIQLISSEVYKSQDQKFKIYQKKLSLSNIPQYLKNYQLFIKQKFNKTQKQKELIQIIKTRQDFSINFKKSATSLFIKLFLQSNQTKMLGSINRYENNYQFYRKFMHQSNSIQEVIMNGKKPLIFQYAIRPIMRPKQCLIQISSLHNSSVTYINQFINEHLHKINQLINYFVNNKYAQVQLENSRHRANKDQVRQDEKAEPLINYTLQQVQNQIYSAVKRKQNSSGKHIGWGNKSRRISQHQIYQNKSLSYTPLSQNKNQQIIPRNNNSPYMRALYDDSNNMQNKLGKSKSNVILSSAAKNYDYKESQSRITAAKTKQAPPSSSKKYAYLDDMQNQNQTMKKQKTPIKYEGYQNIKRLTQDYENIKKQIELSTPKGRNKKPNYFLDNSVYQSSLRKVDFYNQSSNKYTPLSQKKVFKYIPS